MLPDPVLPAVVTVKTKLGEKLAPTLMGDVPTVKLQAPVPEQAPVHPANVDPPDAVWFNVMTVPLFTLLVHVPVHPLKIVVVESDTEPLPLTISVTANCATLNVAVTDCAVLMLTMQGAVPEQPPPLQPANVEAADEGMAVNVTEAFWM